MTLTDMLDALRGQEKANEAIFWYCYIWHTGRGSDLYKIMVQTKYDPFFNPIAGRRLLNPGYNINTDPELLLCWDILGTMCEKAYGGSLPERPYTRIKFSDLHEDDIITAEPGWGCIQPEWPCKVFLHHGAFAVNCVDSAKGREPHALRATNDGYVKGFHN